MTPLHHAATAALAVLDSLPDQTHAAVARGLRRALEVSPAEPVAPACARGGCPDKRACEEAQHCLHTAPQPSDPLDWPLPCDVTVGPGTHKAGTPLRSLVGRMEVLHAMVTQMLAAPQPARAPLTLPPLPNPKSPASAAVWVAQREYARACAAAWGVTLADDGGAPQPCPHRDEPRGCYRVRCQLGRRCADEGGANG